MTGFIGVGLTDIRCPDRHAVAAVYRTATGDLFVGSREGMRSLGEDDIEPFTLHCSACGQPVPVDPVELRRAARAGRRNYPVS